MENGSNFNGVYFKYIGPMSGSIKTKKRCQVCFKFFDTSDNYDRLCSPCKSHGSYLFLQNLHDKPFLSQAVG